MDSATVGAPRQPRQQRLIRWQVAIFVCFFLIVVMVARVLATEGQSDHRVPLKCLTIVALDFRVLGWTEVRARQTVQSALGIISLRPETEAVAAHSGLGPRTPLASLTPVPSGRRQSMYMLAATSGIFDAFSIPLVRGRGFSGTDDARAPLVIVVSERTARTLFETTDVVGKQVTSKRATISHRGLQRSLVWPRILTAASSFDVTMTSSMSLGFSSTRPLSRLPAEPMAIRTTRCEGCKRPFDRRILI
jgi:MacB-like periplasmic core domain